MRTSRASVLRCAQVVRTQATLARVAQIRTFVGRRIHARAARHRHWRRLYAMRVSGSWEVSNGCQPYFDTSLRSSTVLLPLSMSLRPLSDTTPADHCHGHKTNATIVMVVSRQFERVRVEQNHCQGLRTVTANYPRSVGVCESRANRGSAPAALYDIPWPTRRVNLTRKCESQASMCRNPRVPTQRPALFWARRSGAPHARRPKDHGGMRGNRQACRWQRRGADVTRIEADGSIPAETRRGSATTTLEHGADPTHPSDPGARLLALSMAESDLPSGF